MKGGLLRHTATDDEYLDFENANNPTHFAAISAQAGDWISSYWSSDPVNAKMCQDLVMSNERKTRKSSAGDGVRNAKMYLLDGDSDQHASYLSLRRSCVPSQIVLQLIPCNRHSPPDSQSTGFNRQSSTCRTISGSSTAGCSPPFQTQSLGKARTALSPQRKPPRRDPIQ